MKTEVLEQIEKAVELGTENLPEVKTMEDFKNVKVNQRFFTYNYDLILRKNGNRGGEDVKRSKKFFDPIILNGRFDYDYTNVKVDTDNEIFDGTCTVMAKKRYGLPIVAQKIRKKTLEETANYNSQPATNWKPKTNFMSAIEVGYPVAILLDEIRDIIQTRYNLKGSGTLKEGELFGCVIRSERPFKGGRAAAKLADYKSEKILNLIDEDAKYSIDRLGFSKQYISKSGIQKVTDVTKEVMKLHFNSKKFSLDAFCRGLEMVGVFAPKTLEVANVVNEIKRLERKGKKLFQTEVVVKEEETVMIDDAAKRKLKRMEIFQTMV